MRGFVDMCVVLFFICFVIGILAATLHGLYLAFSASILLGIIVLFVEPAPLVIGLVYWFWRFNIAEALVHWFTSL